jgi:transposase
MRSYSREFKVDALTLSKELGRTKTAKELGIPLATLETWYQKSKRGELTGMGTPPQTAITLAEEVKRLKQENKELRRTNEILKDAAVFFAASQKK